MKELKRILKLILIYIYYDHNIVDDYFIVLDKDTNVVCDSRIGDIDIERYIDYSSFNDRENGLLSKYLIDRMIEPKHIKRKEIIFYFEKGIDIPFDFCKSYKKVIGTFKELDGGYYTKFGTTTLLGIVYCFT